MATLSHAESRRLYSWWWDSHISPKHSKWLQDNLSDMDNKIKGMIRLIEEDADSFAQRAEMYYKKRPELTKLVEEFYRAYRALAERYDHATGALRQAHRTIAEVFPNQIPSEFCDESPDGCPDPDAGINNPEMPQGILNSDGLHHNLLGFSFHHEAMKLNEAYLDETKVTPNEAYLKQLSEMFVTREDATGPNFVEGREGKYSEYKLLQQEISRLSKETQDLKKQVASESARADKNEKEVQHLKETCSKEKSEKQNALTQYLDSMERVSYLEDEISRTKADLQKLNDEMLIRASCLNSAKEQSLILEKANQSLRLELDILKQKIREQQEELNKKGQDLEILNISLQVEHQKNMKAEMACQSIEKQHTESQEEMKHLKQDIISGVEKLKDVEEELQKIREENARLSSKKLSSALKIMNLQDEIISLIDLKRKLEDEADLHIEEKEVLQLELCRLKKDRNDLEQKYHALREEIQAVNLSVESLQALIKELKDRNLDLKGTIKKNQDEKLIYLENLNHMRTMSEKNAILEASLLDANGELERLRMKIKELEDSSDHLRYRISIHLAEKAALISHMEASAQNMEKLLKKNAFLENSLSDMNVELEGWRTKLKGVQESCKSLHDEKSCLLNEKYTLINQVESIKQSLENLEGRYCDLEDKNLNLERQKDSTLHHVAELQELLRLEKKDNSTLIHSSKSQLSTLANQICLLQEEGQQREEDLETEQHKIMDAQIEIFIFRRCLCDMKEENLILSVGSQKHQEALRCTEKLILELERECLIQEKKIKSLTEHNEKLREWIHLIIKSLKIDLQYISLDDTKDELLLQLVLLEIRQMLHTISEAQDEKQHLLLEKSVVVTLLEQLGKYVSDLRAEKTSLERESKIRLEEFTLLKNKNDEFLEVNKELRKEMQASNQREEALRAEVDLLFRQLTYLQEVDSTLQIKISKMLEENNLISKKIHDLSQEKVKLEEVNNVILTEVMALDYLSVMFKSLNSERACELKLLTNETEYLYKVKNKLEQEIRPINENIVLDVSEAKVREEMEKKISILLEDCSCKENEIECLCQENKVLKCEVSKLLKDVEELRSRDENLNSELQKKIGEVKSSDVVITSLLCDIQFETINATVFKEKVLELIKTCENLESRAIVRKEVLQEEIKLRNLTINKLEKKIYVLEEENGGLRADFNAYAHDLGSLWDDIAILEELTLSLAGRHSTSINQTKEDDQVEPYPCNPSNREPGQDYNTTASTRLLKLQHLHDRVKVLQEVVMNTGSILELERFDSNASLESAWKEIEGLKSKGIPDNEMTKSKYEQIMKDIQLDIVLNSSRHGNGILSHGRRKSRKTDETTDQILELWGTAKGYDSQKQKGALAVENNMTHYQIEEEGIYSSGELVAEKEVGVDKLDLHKKVVPHQEWNRRVIERLFSDSQRLLVLQASVHELQKNIETSEKISRPSRSEFNAIKLQLKETEGSISDLIHVNSKLTSKVEDLSASPHNRFEEKEETDNGSKRWKQISDWARKVSEKIGRLELEMPKIQYSLLKFEEEHMNKRTRVVKRRSGIRLREYIYGRRNSRRQREDYSCGCMRPTTTIMLNMLKEVKCMGGAASGGSERKTPLQASLQPKNQCITSFGSKCRLNLKKRAD